MQRYRLFPPVEPDLTQHGVSFMGAGQRQTKHERAAKRNVIWCSLDLQLCHHERCNNGPANPKSVNKANRD